MKGLIIKDFKMIRHESIISLLIPTLFFIISMIGHNVMYFTCFSVMMFSLVPTMNIANDEKWKWDKYETVLPIKKEHIVLEKYIMLFLFVIPIILIESIIIYFITGYSANDMASLVSIMFLFGILSPAIILPVYYLFGYNTGRIVGVPINVPSSIDDGMLFIFRKHCVLKHQYMGDYGISGHNRDRSRQRIHQAHHSRHNRV